MVACMGRCMPTWIVHQWNGVDTENIWLIIGSAQNLGWWSTQQFEETLLIVQSPLYCIVFTEILTGLNFCQSSTWHWLLTLILAEMSVALFGGLLTGAHFTFQPPCQRRYLSCGPYANKYLFLSPKIFDPRSSHSSSALIVCLFNVVIIFSEWCDTYSFRSKCFSNSKQREVIEENLQTKTPYLTHRTCEKYMFPNFRLNLKTEDCF